MTHQYHLAGNFWCILSRRTPAPRRDDACEFRRRSYVLFLFVESILIYLVRLVSVATQNCLCTLSTKEYHTIPLRGVCLNLHTQPPIPYWNLLPHIDWRESQGDTQLSAIIVCLNNISSCSAHYSVVIFKFSQKHKDITIILYSAATCIKSQTRSHSLERMSVGLDPRWRTGSFVVDY